MGRGHRAKWLHRGTFKLPVVVHGEQAWWDIKDHAALAQELKARVHTSAGLGPGGYQQRCGGAQGGGEMPVETAGKTTCRRRALVDIMK